MPLRQALGQVQPYRPQPPMQELARIHGRETMIKLASNEGAFGPLPEALAAYEETAAILNRYPDGGALPLRSALAEQHGVGVEQVVLGNGADELIRLCAVATLDPGDAAVFPWPSFPSYVTAAACSAAGVIRVSPVGRASDLEGVLAALGRAPASGGRARLVYLANPNNPTGTLLSREAVGDFAARLPAGVLCVLDEAYAEYADPEPEGPELLREGAGNLCVLRTFSKVHGLAALRVGYALASPAIAEALQRVRPIFNVNQSAQAAALASLGARAALDERIAHARRARVALHDTLAAAGLDPEPSQANFVYAGVPGSDAEGLAERLLGAGFIVRWLGGFGAPDAIRVTVGTDAENAAFAAALPELV